MKRFASLFLLPLSAAVCLALAQTTAPASPNDHFILENNVAMPMRDGIVLRADILRPPQGEGFPVLVYRTPYNKESALKDYEIFRKAVERGYAVVIQDVRGRYASEGGFVAYQNEGRDGFDTIEWAARQPWSNGSVGTFGLSYPGAVQWLAAIENPPHLKAMVPAMTFSTPRNFFYSGGVFDGSWLGWIWNNIAPDVRVRKNLLGPKTHEEAIAEWNRGRARLQGYLPLSALPDLKEIAPYYYEWMKHPAADPWWNWCELRHKYANVHAAVLNLSGWYDEAYGPEGATTNFNGLMAARKGQRELRTKTLIGPWVHGASATRETKAGEREFGPAAAIDYDETVLRWMDHYLRGSDNGVDREKPVRIFVMGENIWRDEEQWPPKRARATSFYLAAAEPGRKAARLEPTIPGKNARSSEFVSDPANPVTDPYPAYSGAHDYREMEKRSDVLIFDSAPLEQDLEVTGQITAEIYLSCDAPDTDLWVRLLDVAPDGTAFNLMSPGLDVVRASYRNQTNRRELLTPGRIYMLRLDQLRTSNVFKKGHRIRAQISTTFFPHFSRNLHTGELETVSAKMRAARISIYHDMQHPSRLILPAMPYGLLAGG